ncbi:hypothetical protein PLICRDRAFT_44168 [Plicaturopsis crispa FD-325 SS-3]|nr:hypothetical protein PLICRDRAFT_44168 [Plicaturopsis crispa FD-325 SS-3]
MDDPSFTMDDPDIVETSDNDEREAENAARNSTQYWTRATSDLAPRPTTPAKRWQPRTYPPSPSGVRYVSATPSPAQTPRKRMKIRHDSSPSPSGLRTPVAFARTSSFPSEPGQRSSSPAGPPATSSSRRSRSSSSVRVDDGEVQGVAGGQIAESPRKRTKIRHDSSPSPPDPRTPTAPIRPSAFPSNSGRHLTSPTEASSSRRSRSISLTRDEPESMEVEQLADNSQDPLLLYSNSPPPVRSNHSLTPEPHSRTPQHSQDPLHLFSSPIRTKAASEPALATMALSSPQAIAPSSQDDGLFTPRKGGSSPFSSPLSFPPSSQPRPRVSPVHASSSSPPSQSRAPGSSRAPNSSRPHISPVRASSSRAPNSSAPQPSPALLAAHPSPASLAHLALQHETHLETRYTLRARQAKQLNPYAYDKLAYKRALRAHPDAIVRFVSPGRRREDGTGRRSRSAARDDGTQWEGTQDQEWLHADADAPEDESWEAAEERRQRRRMRRQEAHPHPHPHPHPHTHAQTHAQAQVEPRHYPELLQHGLSSDSESEDAGLRELRREARRARKVRERREAEERRRRVEEDKQARVREREKQARAREEGERERRKRGKAFPMPRRARTRSRESGSDSDLPDAVSRKHVRTPSRHSDPPNAEPRASPSDRQPSEGPRAPSFDAYDHEGDQWMGNFNGGDDYDMPGSPTHSQSPARSPARSPIVILSDADPHQDDSSTTSSSSSSSRKLTAKERKKLKAARRMMPGVMLNRLAEHNNNSTRRRRSATRDVRSSTRTRDVDVDVDGDGDVDADVEEEGPLLPGQTRVRMRMGRTHTYSGNVDIRGDSESSDLDVPDAPYDAQHSDSDAPRRKVPNRPAEVIEIEDSSSSSEGEENSSDNEVDDAEINAWLANRDRPREEASLVDYMLAATRTVGGGHGRGTGKGKGKGARRRSGVQRGPRRHDVVTGGARRYGVERQTRLPFGPAQNTKPASSSRKQQAGGLHKLAKGSTVRRHARSRQDDADSSDPEDGANVAEVQYVKEHGVFTTVTRNKRWKRPRPRQLPGVYTFRPNGAAHTGSGRRRNGAIHVGADDEGFHDALNPRPKGDAPAPRQKHRKPRSTTQSAWTRMLVGGHDVDPPSPVRHADTFPQHADSRHNVKLDFDISFLPSGITFGAHTYLGKGWLHELASLVSGDRNIPMPLAYSAFEFELSSAMEVAEFSTAVVHICGRLFEFVASDDREPGLVDQWTSLMRTVCQLVSWYSTNTAEDDYNALRGVVQDQASHLVSRIEDWLHTADADGASMDTLGFSVYWFAIELSARVQCSFSNDFPPTPSVRTDTLVKLVLVLMRRLREYGLERTIDAVQHSDGALDAASPPQRTAELWICLFHLVNSCDVQVAASKPERRVHPFWQMVQQELESEGGVMHGGLDASEEVWRLLFSLSALSQFSVHGMSTSACRLSASWELVALALKKIRLVADPEMDAKLSDRTLEKRDDYIWLVASRCFLLWDRWHWPLDDASVMFNQLVEIFKSRKFANLRREPSDFPGFMLENDMRLLSQYRHNDTAFEIFLKLVVQAAKAGQPDGVDQVNFPPKLKKLLSLSIPVGSVPFTKTTPPTVQELSQLYNRLSAVAITIYLDTSPANVKYRMAHARRYVNFKEADDTTRMACIRGMMHFATLMQHRHVPLNDVYAWLTDMTVILVNEYKEAELALKGAAHGSSIARDRVVFAIQVLLGSVRRIIETPQMDPTQPRVTYPDPALLQGPWVTEIFAKETNLSTVAKTGLEIRRLVQAFLDARAVIMPAPPRPRRHAAPDPNQDSQDEYGMIESFDYDDPELRIALGEVDAPQAIENKTKDEQVSQVIDKHISPAIYRLICKHFNDPSETNSIEEYCHDADKWIDCWVGCANVVVQNTKRDWSRYLTMGPQSWERIIDPSWRRRVGLRFMFMMLRLDPPAYLTHTDRFLDVLLESMVSPKITLENEYMSLLFSIDGLAHPLLRGVPCQLEPGVDLEMSRGEFLNCRQAILKAMFSNLNESLDMEAAGDKSLTGHNQTCVGFLITMFSTMQDVYQKYEVGSLENLAYAEFCRQIVEAVNEYPTLKAQARLVRWVEWGLTLLKDKAE